MRALIQRVSEGHVSVAGTVVGKIGKGLLVLVGVRRGDTTADAEYLARKVTLLRIFPDENGKMNRSVLDICGEILIVSQFTLYGETRKGNRPSYSAAELPEAARTVYEHFVEMCRRTGSSVATGVFQAHMEVKSVNDGPVTLLCCSESDIF
jgi:D-tyrosyl-tRNA(Tyr) deacylase